MKTELLIFDLDGTLVDSSVDISNALNYAIEPFDVEPVSLPETLTLIGEGVTRLVGKLIEKRGTKLDLSVLLDRFPRALLDPLCRLYQALSWNRERCFEHFPAAGRRSSRTR